MSYYKHHLSDYEVWTQKGHATDWVLLPENIGEYLSIDETQLCEEVYTILSNKVGHGGQGTVVAIVKGTKADVVSRILMMTPESERAKVKEIKAARDCIKSREVEVLNYFINRATNASAESLNSKMKGFRAQLHGIADIPFFMYRICTIFG